jgi:predicted N-acyltransferase
VPDYPFLTPQFLSALEDSGSATAATGWVPHHLTTADGALFMPLYVKTHSYGEYVFDWAWANAYHRSGLSYYPKLVTAIPFSPITGPRLRLAVGAETEQVATALLAAVREVAEATSASSWHLLFPDAPTRELLRGRGLLERTGVQFHWHNRGYESFEHFLAGLASRKRKMVRRERSAVATQGLSVAMLEGPAIGADLWSFFHGLYQNTYAKRSGNGGYLSRDFFHRIGKTLADQIAMAVACHADQPVAAALYFHDRDTLYGRYWGCVREYECLHFELCYYQGIDYAIRRGLGKFDAGAQGEHKIPRGFAPVETHSLHWIRNRGFATAVADFLARERVLNQNYMDAVRAQLPYRQES